LVHYELVIIPIRLHRISKIYIRQRCMPYSVHIFRKCNVFRTKELCLLLHSLFRKIVEVAEILTVIQNINRSNGVLFMLYIPKQIQNEFRKRLPKKQSQ
jgi:hypothetical protein